MSNKKCQAHCCIEIEHTSFLLDKNVFATAAIYIPYTNPVVWQNIHLFTLLFLTSSVH